jgi:hypothetical protein
MSGRGVFETSRIGDDIHILLNRHDGGGGV